MLNYVLTLIDITVFNAADESSLRLWDINSDSIIFIILKFQIIDYLCIDIIYACVENDGTVKINLPYLFKTSCGMNIADFPFDNKVCILKFGR